MARPEPIRAGDRFTDHKGEVWSVYHVYVGGRVGLLNRARWLFHETTHKQLRAGNWKRVAPPPPDRGN